MLTLGLATSDDNKSLPQNEGFVPMNGSFITRTSLGFFLEVAEVAQRRVFIPINCTPSPSWVLEADEPATILVLRSFAEREVLVEKQR